MVQVSDEEEQLLELPKDQQKQNQQVDSPVVEDEIHGDENDDEDDHDNEEGKQGAGANEITRQSRSEKKSRKAILKLGMEPIAGVTRVTIKRTKDILVAISKPDVFRSLNSEAYVIFGEANLEDLGSQLQTRVADRFRMPVLGSIMDELDVYDMDDSDVYDAALTDDDEDEDIDDTGVKSGDIDLVMAQAGVPRGKAIKVLKAHDGDIINAIMDLTV